MQVSTGRRSRARGKYVAIGLAVALFVLHAGPGALVAEAAKPPQPAKQRNYAQYATDSYNAMQKYLYTTNSLYEETYPAAYSGNPYAYHWPFSQAMAGTLDMSGLSTTYRAAVQDRQTGAGRYWDGAATWPSYASYVLPPLGQGGEKYYDDNAWSGLNLVRLYRMSGSTDTAALERAKQVFAFIESGWDTKATCYPGGVFWKQQPSSDGNRDRNTVSTAPSAILGLRLYQLTGDSTYLTSATKMYDWVNATLRDPADGLYWDHVRGDCTIDMTKWSYNQGTMVGASVLLYQITGQVAYLQQAERIANAALNYYSSVGYFGQDPAFNAIYFRNLLLLHAATASETLRGAIRTAMESYANQVWDDSTIHKRTHLFYFHAGHAKLVNQGAMVEIYACLAWDPSGYDLLV